MFQDHFSKQAKDYSRYRPRYPKELFEFIAQHTQRHDVAWDCATGNGQAAVALADYFDQVIATDASEKQIQEAIPNKRVSYRVASAEQSGLADHSVDCITVAQALHWFDFDRFYKEVQRVAKSNSVLAVWYYSLMQVEDPKIDACLRDFYSNEVGPYWPAERDLIDEGYAAIPFPFDVIAEKTFVSQLRWNFDEFMGYVSTWSAVARYKDDRNEDPVALHFAPCIEPFWGGHKSKKIFTIEFPVLLGSI